jgi:hypothetical protein
MIQDPLQQRWRVLQSVCTRPVEPENAAGLRGGCLGQPGHFPAARSQRWRATCGVYAVVRGFENSRAQMNLSEMRPVHICPVTRAAACAQVGGYMREEDGDREGRCTQQLQRLQSPWTFC